MLSFPEKIIFILIIFLTMLFFSIPVIFRIRIIRSGLPEKRFNNPAKRIRSALAKIFLQKCTLKNERVVTGFFHVFIFYGALTFDTATINHTFEGFIDHFFLFGNTSFGLFFSFLVDFFAIFVLVGVAFFAFKRFIIRPKAYATTHLDSGLIYFFLTVATLSYLYFETFSMAFHLETGRLAFLGEIFSKAVLNSGMSAGAIAVHFKISWWLHILLVYAFIVYVPHSKYFHMFTGSVNLLFRSHSPLGELKALDIENTEVFGVEKALDYTWKDLLDGFACMECGRCQDACPAFASDKPLSPKMIVFNLRQHLLKEGKKIINKNKEESSRLIDGTYSEGEIWSCTTCGACMHVCPVEIEHIRKIVGVRQSQVLMESKFPPELNSFFRNLETNSNPWGIGFQSRAEWARDLDVKLMSETQETDYLFWVGCAGSFDEEGKKIARSLAKILTKAGINFAILGAEEKCCGDSARRLGNEYLFQMLAAENIQLFKKYSVKKIIVTCPHGYHTFKNEYPALLDILPVVSEEEKNQLRKIEVIHHSQLILSLIQEGRLSIKGKSTEMFTCHDSCYLGRHNGLIQEPRDILACIGERAPVEMKNSGEHSFCCGAGGGLMWTEESLGKRINHIRTDEVILSGADTAVTSCPFCLTMLQDGLKDKENTHIHVKDIAQLVADALES